MKRKPTRRLSPETAIMALLFAAVWLCAIVAALPVHVE